MKLESKMLAVLLVALLFAVIISSMSYEEQPLLKRFSSDEELVKAFENAESHDRGVYAQEALATAKSEYSTTNIQVEGVDEADIIKTDGEYIYAVSGTKIFIIRAYPAENAEIISSIDVKDFVPSDILIEEGRLLVFGSEQRSDQLLLKEGVGLYRYPYYSGNAGAKLYDISDKQHPVMIKDIGFEGNYITSRMIGSFAYFVINSYPHLESNCSGIIPLYREDGNEKPVAKCTEIGYIEPVQAGNFITIAAISLRDGSVSKETIVGSGQNVYASEDNIYIAQQSWPVYGEEKTHITKFRIKDGKIEFAASAEVQGHVLNQFSMDEYNSYFRIATTSGKWGESSSNNIYILDESLSPVGSLEALAPGESIYSARFMGSRCYLVTFKKVDPLFVIDLSDSANPKVLGKLKIPGYSDYLHPYDDTHIIGIGKDTTESEGSFAWYQGVKMAVFDVTDVENPKELHKVIIGDRGTDSDVLRDHKAFLFDRATGLMVLPITLAEIKSAEIKSGNEYGDFTFQGAYVYELTIENGFVLRGRITHYDDEEIYKKSGFYFTGDYSITRSLYIDDVLYTFSARRLQLNSLSTLGLLKSIELE
ncbi:MAG: beta-propeller domain-containing protein [Candidatus Aenigmarchaeota archaeon]|nr:beta-propeller domain-containing protein [Candidatus Aenigmarchaeota archaeon]